MQKVSVTTSWDDGHILDITLSELLKKYGIKATFYVSPLDREIKKEDRLTDEQIIKLSGDFEIGAHTMTHPHLTTISDDEAKKEIEGSKKYLENILNKPVTSFCYPAGYYTNKHKDILKEVGFKIARTVDRHFSSIGTDFFAIPTTVHAYKHYSDAIQILNIVGIKKFFGAYMNWDELAMAEFDNVMKSGGVFHLWGHSWEIDKNNDWDRLERVLKYISNREGVSYVSNSELV